MSTTDHEPTEYSDESRAALPPKEPGHRRAARAGWGAYRHVAAVLGAIGMAALVAHFGVDWRGALATVVGVWDLTIRPLGTFAFHYVITVPLGWLGVEFEMPLWVRDYLSVGVILGLSYWRTRPRIDPTYFFGRNLFRYGGRDRRPQNQQSAPHWPRLIYLAILWPIAIPLTLANLIANTAFRPIYYERIWRRPVEESPDDSTRALLYILGDERGNDRSNFYRFALVVSPLLYLSALLAINSLL